MNFIDQSIIPWLFVLAFIIHDGEEIFAIPPWLKSNTTLLDKLVQQLPVIEKPLRFVRNLNQRQFAFSVLFLLIVITGTTTMITFQPAKFVFQFVFVGIVGVYSLHFFIHFFQSLVVKKIVPGTITSALMLPVSIYVWQNQIQVAKMTPLLSLQALMAGLVISLFAFILAHQFGLWAGGYLTSKD
jgi:hypothetical protein